MTQSTEAKRKQILIALLVLACVGFGVKNLPRHFSLKSKSFSPPLERGPIIETVYGIGTVIANKSFQFKPGIVSTVQTLFVKEGDFVSSGQKIVELDHQVVISAPFDGTITALPSKIGENIFSQTIVFELVDLKDRYVTVSLEQRAAIRVHRGQKAKLSFENLRETSFSGEVESVYSNQGNFIARIEVHDLPPQILPGMTADVAIAISQRDGVLLVPVAAIREGEVIVKRGKQKPFPTIIKTGLVDGAVAEVVSGNVEPGDCVMIPSK